MYLADYHVHSCISPDASCSMTEMAGAAVKAGLDELCFTDHMEPIIPYTVTKSPDYDWEPLIEEFRAAETNTSGLKLRLGVELGEAPWDFSWCEEALSRAPEELDFIIGSIHVLSAQYSGLNLYYCRPGSEEDARAVIADYLEQVRLLAEWGRFSVLGHLTLPLRYFNENLGFHLTFDGYEEQIKRIFCALLENGCGIELNTNRGNAPLPDEKWLRLYRSLGGEMITLGTDAHSPRYVGHHIMECQKLLKDCGFTKFCTFQKLEPVWHEL